MKNRRKVLMAALCMSLIAGAVPARAAEIEDPSYRLKFSVMHEGRFITEGDLGAYRIVDITYNGNTPEYRFPDDSLKDLAGTPEQAVEKAAGEQNQLEYAAGILKGIRDSGIPLEEQHFQYNELTNVDSFGVYLVFQGETVPEGFRPISPFLVKLTREDRLTIGTHEVYEETVLPKQLELTEEVDPVPDGDDHTDPSSDPKRPLPDTPPSEGSRFEHIRENIESVLPPGSVKGESRPFPEDNGLWADRLPQTGQLWWPVPVLVLSGLFLIISGIRQRRTYAETM